MTVTSREQMKFLDAVVMRYVDRMDAALEGQFRELGRTLEAVNRSQREAGEITRATLSEAEGVANGLGDVQTMITTMAGQIREVARATKDMQNATTSYLEELQKSARQAEDGYVRISNTVEQMNLVTGQQTNYLKSVSAMQAEVTRAVESMNATVAGFTSRFAAENAAASQAMQKASGELRTVAGHLENVQKQTSEAMQDELRTTLDAYRDYVNQFTQRVDYLASSISDALSRLPRAVGETSDQFLDQMEQLTRVLEQAQRALGDAVDRLYGR